MKSDCPPHDRLGKYLIGELPAKDMAALEGHAETCPACLKTLARLSEATDLQTLCRRDAAPVLSPRLRRLRATPPLDLSLTGECDLPSIAGSRGSLPEIPGYEMLRELGRGGRGVVYLAREHRLGRLVAVKMILDGAQASPEDLARFQVEAQALAALNHPHLVMVHLVAEWAGKPYYVMEYVPGGNLRQYLAGRRLSHAEAATLLLRLAEALAAVHAAGFVHRDLKPDNVLMAAAGAPKVSDFGLARQAGWNDERITRTGAVLGTPLYMAPEQAAGRGQEIGPAADVYSLGAILYELLTGVPPIQGSGMMALLAELLLREPVAPRRLVPSIPRELETICLKCLHKEPARRYPTAQALAEDLGRFLAHQPILARPPSWLYRLGKFAQRHRALVGGICATASALVLGLVATILFAVAEADQRSRAEQNAQAAEQHARTAEKNARAAQAEKSEAEFQAYRASTAAAVLALSAHDVADAKRHLDAAPKGLRGWEWRHLYGKLDDSARTLSVPIGTPVYLLGAPGRLQYATFTRNGMEILDLESGRRKTVPVGPNRGSRATAAQTRLGLRVAIWVGPTTFELLDDTAKVLCRGKMPQTRQPDSFVVVSRDGKRLASYWKEGKWSRLAVFDAATGMQTAVCEGHPGKIRDYAFSPDGTRLASVGEDRAARVWDVDTGTLVATCRGHKDKVFHVAFRPDGKRLATASSDGTVRQWDAATGEEVEPPYDHHFGLVVVAAYSPCGQLIVSGGFDRTVRVWRATGRQDVAILHGHSEGVVRAVFGPSGRRVATVSDSWIFSPGKRTAAVWDVDPESPLPLLLGHGAAVGTLAYSPDGRWLASGSSDKTVRVWHALTGTTCATLPHPGGVTGLAFAPDGNRLATVNGGDDRLRIWDVASARVLREIQGLRGDYRFVTLSPDGKRAAATLFDGRKYLFVVLEIASGKQLFSADGHVLAYSPDGRWLVAQTLGNMDVLLLDAQAHETVARFHGHKATVWGAAFSPDSRHLATASRDHTVRLWEIDNGKGRVLEGHSGDVFAVAFHPDGTRLATAGRDRSVWLWDVSRGEDVARLQGHQQVVRSLAFSPDGATLASGSGDATVRLWDTAPLRERFQERRRLEGVRPKEVPLLTR